MGRVWLGAVWWHLASALCHLISLLGHDAVVVMMG